jgi:transposase
MKLYPSSPVKLYRPLHRKPGWVLQARALRAEGWSIRAICEMLDIKSTSQVWKEVWDVKFEAHTGTAKTLHKRKSVFTGEVLNQMRYTMHLKDIAKMTGLPKTTIHNAVTRFRRARGLDPTPNWSQILAWKEDKENSNAR